MSLGPFGFGRAGSRGQTAARDAAKKMAVPDGVVLQYDTRKSTPRGYQKYSDGAIVKGIKAPVNDPIYRWQPYSVLWDDGASSAVLGNGRIDGFYFLCGFGCFVQINFTWGNTTSSSGSWTFSVPFDIKMGANVLGSAWAVDITTPTFYTGACILNTSNKIIGYFNAVTQTVRHNIPFTWAVGDLFSLSVFYPIQDLLVEA